MSHETYKGEGRLWETMEVDNIKLRMENLMRHIQSEKSKEEKADGYLSETQIISLVRSAVDSQMQELYDKLEKSYNETVKAIESELGQMKNERNHFRLKMQQLQREKEHSNRNIQDLTDKNEQLTQHLDEYIKNALNAKQQQIDDLQKQSNESEQNSKSAFTKQKKQKKQFEKRIDELEVLLEEFREQHRLVLQERNQLRMDHGKSMHQNKSLHSMIENIKNSDAKVMDSRLNELNTELNKTQKRLLKTKNENHRLDIEYNSLLDRYNEYQEEFGKLLQSKAEEEFCKLNFDDQDRFDNALKMELMKQRKKMDADFKKQRDDMLDKMGKERQEMERKFEKMYQRPLEIETASVKERDETIIEKNMAIMFINEKMKNMEKERDDTIEQKNIVIMELKEKIKKLKNENDNQNMDFDQKYEKWNCDKNELKRLINLESARFNDERNKYERLREEKRKTDDELKKALINVGKYKLIWDHFYMQDIPIKDLIESAKRKLDRFEHEHGVSSAIPKKKSKIMIEHLDQCDTCPLKIGSIPAADDPYQRFELTNTYFRKSITFRGCHLENENEDIISSKKLNGVEINPGRSVFIALKKKYKKTDILHNTDPPFCTFTSPQERLYLVDSLGTRLRLWPSPKFLIENLNDKRFSDGNFPMELDEIYNEKNKTGFALRNNLGEYIALKNFYLRNKDNKINTLIAYKELPVNGVIRVFTSDTSIEDIGKNDIVLNIRSSDIEFTKDTFFLADSFGNHISIFQDSDGFDDESCFVM